MKMFAGFISRPLSFRSRRGHASAPTQTTRVRNGRRQLPRPGQFRAWLAFKRLTALGLPPRFPIVQFPNVPLIAAFAVGEVGRVLHGREHSFALSAAYLAMTIWAYEELVHGVNWFRRLLGLAYVIILVIRVAHGLQA
jgi:hypothetical protein